LKYGVPFAVTIAPCKNLSTTGRLGDQQLPVFILAALQ